jgi:hypothetical protein
LSERGGAVSRGASTRGRETTMKDMTNTRLSGLIGDPGPLTSREAVTRFAGAGVLLAVGYLHLMDISHKIEEGIWYMAFLFAALIVSSIALAVALVRADDSRVRFVWVAAAGLAAGAMFGYFVSRSIALPGMADHRGDWFSSIGIFAWLFEMALVGLAAFALRDRVLRTRARRPRRHRVRAAAPALSLLWALALQPATALAHGGEEMSAEEMRAEEMATQMGHKSGSMDHSTMSHDPLLGGFELTVILLLGLALLAWCGTALSRRVGPAVRRPHRSETSTTRRRPSATPARVAQRAPSGMEPPTVPLSAAQSGRRSGTRQGVSPA